MPSNAGTNVRVQLKKLELRYRLYGRIIEVIGVTIHRAIPWGGLVVIGYYMYRSVSALSGHTTFANIILRFLADFRVTEGVAYIFGLGGIGYGLRNRKLRKDQLERMARRVKELESQIDPRRSSSRLTARGETRPEDEP